MHCPSCGREVADSPFCERCGKSLAAAISPDAKAADEADNLDGHPRGYGIVWAVLAIMLYVAIADAAVETFAHESPLRWWFAVAAALYLVLCGAIWRLMPGTWQRMDWTTQAAASLVVLLAFLGATAWNPQGLEQGLRLFGQSTSTVVAVVSAIVVALSGVLLVRLTFIPLPGKIVAGLLALYAVVAFLMAAYAGTPYASLFHGGSQWTHLPFWLQGATVGGLFLLPLALLLEIGTGLRRISRVKTSALAFKVIALCMGLMIAVAAVRMPTSDATAGSDVAGNATSGSAAATDAAPVDSGKHDVPPPRQARYEHANQRLNRIMAGVDVIDGKIDHSLYEIDVLADRLGSDPTAIFHFVRDEIRYEPYTGALRGALGSLLCRAANSLDRSLLLAALLQKAGLKAQIAGAQLTPRQAQILVNRLFEPIKPIPQGATSFAELAPELGRAIEVDPAKLSQDAEDTQKAIEKQQKELAAYVDGEATLLGNLLGKAGVEAGVITPSEQLLAEAGEHYWVQYQNSSEQWVDLDSAMADAEPGKVLVAAANTFAPDSVPEELYYHFHITMTLRVAQIADGKDGPTTDTTLLDQELRVADQQGVDIILANQAVPLPDLTKPGTSFAQALAAVKGFQTKLQVGDQSTSGKYFDLSGRVSDKLGGPVGDVVTNAGGVGGALGGLSGGIGGALGGADSQSAAGRIVGEWVDYRLTSPRPKGQSPAVHSYHRAILSPVTVKLWTASGPPQTIPANVTGDALRRRLMWYAELYPVSGSIVPGYAGYLQLQSLRSGASQVDTLLKSVNGLLPDQTVTMPPRRPIANTLLASEAMYAANKVSNARFPDMRAYFGSPGLISYETGGSGATEVNSFTQGYDIIAYAPRVVASQGGNSANQRQQAASMHMTYGTLATRLERELLAGFGGPRDEDIRVVNATKVFTAAQQLGIPISVLQPGAGSAQQVASITATEPVKSELAEGLLAQQVLLVPSKSVNIDGRLQTAWWRFDPSSGEFVGVGPGGRGQAMEEYIEAAENVNAVICLLGAGKEIVNDSVSKGLLTGLMCVMSRVVGAHGTEADRTMTWLGIIIHVVMEVAENVAPPDE